MADDNKKTADTQKQGKFEEEIPANEIRVGRSKRTEAYVKSAEQLFIDHEDIVLCGLGNSKLPHSLHIHPILLLLFILKWGT
jgi:hypothetical protein